MRPNALRRVRLTLQFAAKHLRNLSPSHVLRRIAKEILECALSLKRRGGGDPGPQNLKTHLQEGLGIHLKLINLSQNPEFGGFPTGIP